MQSANFTIKGLVLICVLIVVLLHQGTSFSNNTTQDTGTVIIPIMELKHKSIVHGLAWSNDGKILATSSGYDSITIWEVSDAQVQSTFSGFNAQVTAIAWHPNQSQLTASFGGTTSQIVLLDISAEEPNLALQADRKAVGELLWSSDGTRLASSGFAINERNGGLINIWSIPSGQLLASLTSIGQKAALNEDLEYVSIAPATESPHVFPIDFPGKIEIPRISQEVFWRPNSNELVTLDWDNTIRMWAADNTIDPLNMFKLEDPVGGMAWNGDGTKLAITTNNYVTGESRLLILDNLLTPITSFSPPQSNHEIRSGTLETVWHASGDYVVMNGGLKRNGNDEIEWVFDATNGLLMATLFHPANITATAWQPNGNLLATSSIDGVVRIWDVLK